MAQSMCFSPITSVSSSPLKPGALIGNNSGIVKIVQGLPKLGSARFQSIEVKAEDQKTYSGSAGTKTNSIVCAACDGNGAKLCTQCEGEGVNSQDHFNGQYKAGGLCWLCRGKREILCGDCNGAGFIGGFMSTFDE
ncbi:protein BUNDLE SHEATH DEFECTIVE 2, chloroplastic [Spinacia oleracea]|uniref:Protein BUNDLE SHEATH DEFECTIVE 2, chloroplastic n=1 Tax=Spinacia oleracea TaxID=3562 RepID=A0A9R0HTR6_SPIOL|nr:protein BUNDLE SHEATH DEFECTIVE 2, chloroplastic [Spinacia oleracea]